MNATTKTTVDAMTKTLLAVHRIVDRHPKVQRRLATLVTRSVGESRVSPALSDMTHAGDCVWDVGANVGVYTRQFLERVGPDGHVVAFEPMPDYAAQIRELGSGPQLIVVEAALADTDGQTSLVVSGPSGETSHIGGESGGIAVRVARGDSLLKEGIPTPTRMKIDVEGFEGDVLDGLGTALDTVRSLVIEVHFAALTRRGRPNDPLRIIALLRDHGFSVRWLDTSHLIATR